MATDTNTRSTLDGEFDPKWGGPASSDFSTLVDWTQRPEAGIKYYSGTATYKTTFSVASLDPKSTYSLNLGNVAIMAQVKLNGQDLGIAWKSPFRLDTAGALKADANQLEIHVVNQWPNRLIGDQALLPEQRLTHETYSTWKKDSPLLPSGLLGPVTIETTLQP